MHPQHPTLPGGAFTAPSGFPDWGPQDTAARAAAIDAARRVVEAYGFARVDTPLVERAELFDRLGEASDVVAKEMYRISDDLVLRPEGTAGVTRAFGADGRRRLWYVGAMLRAERAQAGRFRQFTQLGCEDIAATAPSATAEMVLAAVDTVAVTGCVAELAVGSVGCSDCRPAALDALARWAATARLCEQCDARSTLNPLRILDCTDPGCAGAAGDAPAPLDTLCGGCDSELSFVTDALTAAGVEFTVDRALVRGLDYYRSVTFELRGPDGLAVAGGGRYGPLGSAPGGVGFALGLERCLRKAPFVSLSRRGLGLVAVPGCEAAVLAVARRLRSDGAVVIVETEGRGVRAGLRQLERAGAAASAVLGPDELTGVTGVLVRDLATGAEVTVPLAGLATVVA